MSPNLKAIADGLIVSLKGHVARVESSLTERIDGIERAVKAIPAGAKGDPGGNGRDGKDGRDGIDGRHGIDGRDADPAQIKVAVVEVVREEVARLPVPKDGKDGLHGRDGRDGIDGKSIGLEEVSLLVRAAVAELPPPVAGKDADPQAVRAEMKSFAEALCARFAAA